MECTLQREHSDSQAVKIQEIVNPGTFWVIPDQDDLPGIKINNLLTQHMHTATKNQFVPKEKELVAVRNPYTMTWQRGLVENLFYGARDYKYLIFLVDYGQHIKVPATSIRELPADIIFQKEYYAAQFKLYGIIPCDKGLFNDDFKLLTHTSHEWHLAASTFLNQLLQSSTAVYMSCVRCVDVPGGNVIFGDLHVVINGHCVSIADELCKKKYAVFAEPAFKTMISFVEDDAYGSQVVSKDSENVLQEFYLPIECSDQDESYQLLSKEPDYSRLPQIGKNEKSASPCTHDQVQICVLKDQTAQTSIDPCKKNTAVDAPVLFPGGMNLQNVFATGRKITKQKTRNLPWQKQGMALIPQQKQVDVPHHLHQTQNISGHNLLPIPGTMKSLSVNVDYNEIQPTEDPQSLDVELSQCNNANSDLINVEILSKCDQGHTHKLSPTHAQSTIPNNPSTTGRGCRLRDLLQRDVSKSAMKDHEVSKWLQDQDNVVAPCAQSERKSSEAEEPMSGRGRKLNELLRDASKSAVTNIVNREVSPSASVPPLSGRGRRLKELLQCKAGNSSDLKEIKTPDQFIDAEQKRVSNAMPITSSPNDAVETKESHQGLFQQIKSAVNKTGNGTNSTKSSCHNRDESPSLSSPTETSKLLRSVTIEALPASRKSLNIDFLMANRILVHGHEAKEVEEIQSLTEANFHTVVHMGLKRLLIRTPYRIQRVVWPAVCDGESVVMVNPRHTGKSMAYSAPLVSCLLNKNSYSQIPLGKGPFAVIVCSSCHKCELVLEKILELTGESRAIRVETAFGRSKEEINTVNLTNGCDLLISTPRCLLRMLAMSFVTDLKRICHLVLDEADVLMDKFPEEVAQIVLKCANSKRQRENRGIHRDIQIVTAAEKWSPTLRKVLQPIAPYPLICIGSHMEAAIYARLEPRLEFLNEGEKHDRILEIVAEKKGIFKIVIVCQSPDEVDELYTLLKQETPHLLIANEHSTNIHLADILPQWKIADVPGLYPVLVCCDAVLPEMNIVDATCLIHYSLPLKKTHFDIRFSCLIKNHLNPYIKDQVDQNHQKSIVYIFVGDQNCQQFPVVIEFMKRLKATILPALEMVAEAELLKRDARKITVPLCMNIKTFGECWNRNICPERHAILNSDKPVFIPESGHVKMKLLSVINGTHFTARLLEHTDSRGVVRSFRNNYLKIFRQLTSHFSVEGNKHMHGHPKLGDICAYETETRCISRVQLTGISNYDTLNKPDRFEVLHLDTGLKDVCHSYNLLSLPENLKEIQPLAVNIFLCRLMPPDRDNDWSNAACRIIKSWIQDVEESEIGGPFVIGNIKLSLGNSLWLDPLQGRQCISPLEGQNGLILKDFRQMMLYENLAVDNPNHLVRLYNLCNKCEISIPDYSPTPVTKKVVNSQILPAPQWAYLPDEEFLEVLLNFATNPGQFFICLKKFLTNLKSLENEIQKYVVERKQTAINLIIQTGELCLGRFPDDGLWYRAQVLSVIGDSEQVELFFVDHGERAVVTAGADMIPIEAKHITRLPFQAIECRLVGIQPHGASVWAEEATDELSDFAVNLESDYRKSMFAKVWSKGNAECTGGRKYSILLTCPNDEKSVVNVINKILLTMELAELNETEDGSIEDVTIDQLNITEDIIEEDDNSYSDLHSDVYGSCNDEGADDCKEIIPFSSDFSEMITTNDSDKSHDKVSKSELVRLLPDEKDRLPDELCEGFDFEIDDVARFIYDLLGVNKKKQPTRPEAEATNSHRNHSQLPDVCPVPNAKTETPVALPNDSGHKIPRVIWHQDDISIKISIEVVIDNDNYHHNISNTSLEFTANVNNEVYSVNLIFYGSIYSDRTEISLTGRMISFKLMKMIPGLWSRLQKRKGKDTWLKYNHDYEESDKSFVLPSPFDPAQNNLVGRSRENCVLDVQVFDSDEEDADENYIEEDRPFERKDFFDPLN